MQLDTTVTLGNLGEVVTFVSTAVIAVTMMRAQLSFHSARLSGIEDTLKELSSTKTALAVVNQQIIDHERRLDNLEDAQRPAANLHGGFSPLQRA